MGWGAADFGGGGVVGVGGRFEPLRTAHKLGGRLEVRVSHASLAGRKTGASNLSRLTRIRKAGGLNLSHLRMIHKAGY